MNIDTKEIRNGVHNSKIVYICHYLKPDLNKKALRSIPPTKVIILSNNDLPKNRVVYYSESHFRQLSKSLKAIGRAISPVDNTGYRDHCGNELYVFDNEKECIDMWNKQINEYLVRYIKYSNEFIAGVEKTKKAIKLMKK